MTTGRTVEKHTRVYVDGYDLSGYGRSVGPLEYLFDEANMTVWVDTIKGYLRDMPHASPGTLNTLLDNTATEGSHVVLGSAGDKRILSVVRGIQAAPAAGDPVFAGQFIQQAYQATRDGKTLTAAIPFGGWAADRLISGYSCPWGVLLHAKAARTAPNTGTGIDDNGAASNNGGFMVAHLFACAGTGDVIVKVQHATVNQDASFTDLAGCATYEIGEGYIPTARIIATTSPTTTVNRYLRWQIVLDGITSLTFALSFHRG